MAIIGACAAVTLLCGSTVAAASTAGAGATSASAAKASAASGGAAATTSAATQAVRADAGRVLPRHVFSPYFEAYTTDSPAALAAESGAKYLTLAFLQTPSPGSCTVDWNGDTSTPVSAAVYGKDIAEIKASGGDVVPSFGGYSADTGGTEIADSCTSVPAIAEAYENVITTYGVTRLDMDVESSSLTNTAGIDRRNQAIALVEHWAARTHRVVQFVYTIPTFATGLTPEGLAVLQSAVANHATIDIVNIMTFDYYYGTQQEMGQDTITAADALYTTLKGLYPDKSPRSLWDMVGITEMVGIDDFGPDETFTLADATNIAHWAASTGIGELSFWALQRDNGGCVGTKGAGTCSGVAQSTWEFSHIFEPITRR